MFCSKGLVGGPSNGGDVVLLLGEDVVDVIWRDDRRKRCLRLLADPQKLTVA